MMRTKSRKTKHKTKSTGRPLTLLTLCLIPVVIVLWVWLSPLAFVPVPWPDDSAFYFVAKELFNWPPRWVMLPQAPFEPTYSIYNFNTMPLYPILIGLGRYIGIDGSFALKLWPLGAWALSGVLLVYALYRRGLPAAVCALVALAFSLDPTMRWASVLIRPESLIGLCGVALALGLSFGFPERFKPRGIWDPIAALLALAAYAHFNAIHLLFLAAFGLVHQPIKKIIKTTSITVLYLSPWLITVIWRFDLFIHQMATQWTRLAGGNDWLSSIDKALGGLFQEMGTPASLPADWLRILAMGLWLLMALAIVWGLILPALARPFHKDKNREQQSHLKLPSLAPSAGWILGAIWLWNSKPEVWFTYYIHIAIWTFTGIALLHLWQSRRAAYRLTSFACLVALLIPMVGAFAHLDLTQANTLAKSPSWRWSTYQDFVDCVEARLSQLDRELGHRRPFRVWGPTFPDILIELSRRHPDWDYSRTNDFWERRHLAIKHGRDVEAVVVTEMLKPEERIINAPTSEHPEILSTWMVWKDYFLNELWIDQNWKPKRYLCQRARWQGFIFMN